MKPWLIAAALVLVSGQARAFHEISSFSRTANSGGGAGYFFTGSPRFKSYDCGICHTEAERRIAIELSFDPPVGEEGYEPGTIYRIDVEMLGEHRGLESAFNPNTFAAEVTDAGGTAVGSLLVTPNDIVRLADRGRVAVAEGFGNGETAWTMFWQAPDSPVPAALYLGALDGDGASDPDRRWIDALNDDVALVRRTLCPAGSECASPPEPEPERSAVQCGSSGTGGSAGSVLLVAVAIAAVRRRRVV